MKYYLIRDDVRLDEGPEKRWKFDRFWFGALDEKGNMVVDSTDNWNFIDPTVGEMEPCTYPINLHRDGIKTDFNFTMDVDSIPILSEKAKNALAGLPEIDKPYCHVVLEPVEIDNKNVAGNYYVMIIETQIDCIDEEKSRFCDSAGLDKTGGPRAFLNLVVDPSKVGDHHIFRLKKSLNSIIVSEEVKRRFEKAGVTGAVFDPVNDD